MGTRGYIIAENDGIFIMILTKISALFSARRQTASNQHACTYYRPSLSMAAVRFSDNAITCSKRSTLNKHGRPRARLELAVSLARELLPLRRKCSYANCARSHCHTAGRRAPH